ncbi:MAG: ABC transporter permease [Bacteroidales bacterium]|nr:ABC transporter permease [Bacteroidales bacterium]
MELKFVTLRDFINRNTLKSNFFYHIGHYFLFLGQVFRKPEKWRIFVKNFFNEADKLVINSIPLIALISIFIGAVLVIQTSSNMTSPLLPKMYIGYMARESLILEFSSTMVCLILAGKIGSNISSEIGTMRITEQIDAMEMMGVNSASYLVLPKICSTTLLNPLLTLMSIIVGIIGGYLLVQITGIIMVKDYITGLRFAFTEYYVLYTAIKTSVFSFIISSISSYYGYYANGGSLGVGRSSTKAIVVASAMILIANLILTKIML